MINEQDKKEVVELILENNITRKDNTNWWDTRDRWLDQDGNIWASTDECWKLVERMKRLRAFL